MKWLENHPMVSFCLLAIAFYLALRLIAWSML